MQPIDVSPLIDPNAGRLVFADMDLEQMVTVAWQDPVGLQLAMDINVQHEEWQWDPGSDLTVTLMLAGSTAAPLIRHRVRFDYVGDVQEWVVPEDVTAVTVTLAGGSVGAPAGCGPPAGGAIVVAPLAVTPGDTVYVYVA